MADYIQNYNRNMRDANDIEKLAGELDKQIDELNDLRIRISSNWEGEASDAYQKELRLLITRLTSIRKNMYSASAAIEDAALDIKQKEVSATIINTVTGGGGGGSF